MEEKQTKKLSTPELCEKCSISRRWQIAFRTRKEKGCSEKKLLKRGKWLIIYSIFQRAQQKRLGGWRLVTDWVTVASAALDCDPLQGHILH